MSVLATAPLAAKESLGIYADWGAFRDPSVPRCYAIAAAAPSSRKRDYSPYVTIGTWPKRAIRGQFHARLSRKMAPDAPITLRLGSRQFALVGGGGDAWAADKAADAAIVAAMRSASTMYVGARDTAGNRFSDQYSLDGAASAMDAATVGCARGR
ncbi:MAG: invasion associated locus B family protein [Novosphingobium sp.]